MPSERFHGLSSGADEHMKQAVLMSIAGVAIVVMLVLVTQRQARHEDEVAELRDRLVSSESEAERRAAVWKRELDAAEGESVLLATRLTEMRRALRDAEIDAERARAVRREGGDGSPAARVPHPATGADLARLEASLRDHVAKVDDWLVESAERARAIDERLASLEARPAVAEDAPRRADLDALSQSIAGITAGLEALKTEWTAEVTASTDARAASQAALETMKTEVAALQAALGPLGQESQSMRADLTSLVERWTAFEERASSADAGAQGGAGGSEAIAELTAAVAGLTSRVDELVTRVGEFESRAPVASAAGAGGSSVAGAGSQSYVPVPVRVADMAKSAVVLDGGEALGLRSGDELAVHRGGRAIGRVSVVRVSGEMAGAAIVELTPGEEIRAGDSAMVPRAAGRAASGATVPPPPASEGAAGAAATDASTSEGGAVPPPPESGSTSPVPPPPESGSTSPVPPPPK